MNSMATATERTEPAATTIWRLVFPHGVTNLTLRAEGGMSRTFAASFRGPKPDVVEADGVVTIDYPRFNPIIWGRSSAAVTINPRFAWAVEIRGGISHWDGDLRTVHLGGIEIQGGASKITLELPRPMGNVAVHVSGGASSLALRRPAGVPARIHIGGGASKLGLDQQFFGAIGGPVRLESSGYSSAADGYDVTVGGGASKVSVAS